MSGPVHEGWDLRLPAADEAAWAEFARAPEAERRAAALALKARVDALVRSRPDEAPAVAAALVRSAGGLPALQALALRGRALSAHAVGRREQALADYEAALALHLAAGEELEAARVLRSQVDVLQLLGRAPEALERGARARALFEAHGERRLAAQVDVNVGNVWVRLDEYVKARACYAAARATFAELGDATGTAFADFNLAVVEMNANRVEEAEHRWQAARAGMAAAGMDALVADCDYNRAYLESRRGRFAEALAGLERAREAYGRGGRPEGAPLCDLDTAEILLRLDARRDALQRAQRAAQAFEAQGLHYERARAEVLAGLARARLGDLPGALEELARAAARLQSLGNEAYAAAAALQRAALLARGGRPLEALPALLDARTRLRARELRLLADLATVTIARARVDAGDASGALAELQPLLAPAPDLGRDDLLRAEAQAVAAQAHRALGALDAAVAAGRAACEAVDRSWAAAPGRDLRMAFFRDQHPIWVDLAFDLADQQRPHEALAALEAGRGRALHEALPPASTGPELDAARARLEWLMLRRLDALFGPAAGGHELRRAGAEDAQVAEAQREVARLLRPAGGPDLPAAPAFGPDELEAAQGGGDDVLLVFLSGPRGLRAFVADGRGVRVVRLPAGPADVAALRDRAWLHVDRLRLGAAARPAAVGALRPVLAELGRRLLAPLLGGLEGRPLVVVPYGDLHDLPFHAFRLGDQPVVARHDLSYGLSAGHLARLRRRPLLPAGPVRAAGVPHAGLPRIPEELDALGRLWGGALEVLDPERLPEALATSAASGGMLHLAGHGHFETGHPLFSSVCLGKRFLMAHDVLRLPLGLDLVVLSGCETGRRRRIGGDEPLGLPSALLAAGARAVVGSLWAVEDGDARDVAVALHAELARGAGARAALSAAQRSLHAAGHDELAWAAPALLGDPEARVHAPAG